MTKRSQGKSKMGPVNYKQRVFVLTPERLTYYEGTVEVSSNTTPEIMFCLFGLLVECPGRGPLSLSEAVALHAIYVETPVCKSHKKDE